MKLDIEKYLVHMQGMDLTDKQKRTLLIALSSVVETCLDHAFHQSPTQLVMQERQLSGDRDKKTIVDSTEPKTKG